MAIIVTITLVMVVGIIIRRINEEIIIILIVLIIIRYKLGRWGLWGIWMIKTYRCNTL